MARHRSRQPAFAKILGGLLSGLFAALWKQHKSSKAASPVTRAMPVTNDEEGGAFNTEIVGEASYKRQLRALFGPGEGRKYFDAHLEPEPTNPHDPNAIKVGIDGETVGYLPRICQAIREEVWQA